MKFSLCQKAWRARVSSKWEEMQGEIRKRLQIPQENQRGPHFQSRRQNLSILRSIRGSRIKYYKTTSRNVNHRHHSTSILTAVCFNSLQHHWISSSQIGSFPFSSSNTTSSSTSSDEEPPELKRKRKRKDFFGRLMTEVIHKQEELHMKFLDQIERRERERMAREEANRWDELD